MADDLKLKASFDDKASAGVRKLGKTLAEVKPSHGMAAAQKWMATFRADADAAAKVIKPVSSYMGAIGVSGLAASLSIGEMVKQFKELASQTLALKEVGRQTGLTTTQVKRLQFAAGKLNVDPSKMVAGLRVMSDKMADFHRGASELNGLLNNFDPNFARKLMGDGDDPEKELQDIVDWLAKIPAAQKAIGKSSADAAQIQRRWAEAFLGDGDLSRIAATPGEFASAMADAARKVPEVTKAMEDQAKALNDAVLNLDTSWDKLKNDVGPSVIHGMTAAVDDLRKAFDAIHAHPAESGIAVAAAGAMYARYRIMRADLARGFGDLKSSPVAGQIEAAAQAQKSASSIFAEAVNEFRTAVAEMRGRGGPASLGPAEPTKPGLPEVVEDAPKGFIGKGGLKGVGAGIMEGLFAGMIYQAGEQAMDAVLGWTPKDQKTLDRATSLSTVFNDVREQWFGGGSSPSASANWSAPSAYNREARARRLGLTYDAPNTDGNALHRNDEISASSLTAAELFEKVRDGSKQGIVQGLREMAQEQELSGEGGPTSNAGGGRMLGRGAANMRYGRRGGGDSGAYRGTPVPDAPYNGKNIDGLTPAASKQYAAILGNRESGNRYGITNPYGYAGRWQFGASALAENGYVRPGTSNAGLRNPGAWTGKGGASSMADWLANKGGVQDQAFGEYTNRHYAQLKAAGVIRDGMSPSEVAGWLAAAHLKGVGGAISLARGHDNVDANGTSASSYRRMMQGVGVTPPTPAVPGAGTPAPSGAAVTDAEVFKARQRILNGSRDAADRALVERYKAQQAQPEHHAAGGPIRGPGTGTSDSIPAMLSNGEYVVRAKAAGMFLPLLHAINSGALARFASGGSVGKALTVHRKPWVVPVGFGVDKRFYPASSPGISDAEGRANRLSWRDFFRKPARDGGMGASWATTLGAMAMMQGESGRGLNTKLYDWDVNGPSGGVDQLHDVTTGKFAGRLHRLSDAMTDAMVQHVDWQDRTFQQANFRKEATGSMWWAWRKMLAAKTAAGALRAGVNDFENPAQHDLEFTRRLPNIARLHREAMADAAGRPEMDPIRLDIHHHENGRIRSVRASGGGKGVRVSLTRGPTFASASETD